MHIIKAYRHVDSSSLIYLLLSEDMRDLALGWRPTISLFAVETPTECEPRF